MTKPVPFSSIGSPRAFDWPPESDPCKVTHINPGVRGSGNTRDPLAQFIACVLNRFQNQYDSDYFREDRFRAFRSTCLPPISLHAYVQRIARFSRASDGALILALLYMKSIYASCLLPINALTIYRLFFSCVVLATKFYDDAHIAMPSFARVGGLPTKEANNMKDLLLSLMLTNNTPLLIDPAEYQRFITETTKPTLHQRCGCDPKFLDSLLCLDKK